MGLTDNRIVSKILSLVAIVVVLLLVLSGTTASAQKLEGLDFVSPNMGRDITERIEEGLKDCQKNLPKIEKNLQSFEKQNFRKDSYTVKNEGKSVTYDQMPKRHPLLDSDGVATTSGDDYAKKDTRVMFNRETFGQCFEERQVTSVRYYEECKRC